MTQTYCLENFNHANYAKLWFYGRHDVDCKSEYVPFKWRKQNVNNDHKSHKRQPKYLKHDKINKNFYHADVRGNTKYYQQEKRYRKPGSCYRCCVPYPKPPAYLTTKRPRPSTVWTPRPTR